ncbi:MAG: TetR/AcrR family transcriptional regulator [Nocardioides sp.]
MDFTLLREYEGEDARVALSTLVARVGLDSPSLREIARTASRSPSTLLAWFGSKRELHRRALLALGVRWRQTLVQHPIPAEDRGMEHARLRLAYDELARSDPALAEVLEEIVAFERELLVVWVQRYVPARSWSRYDPPRPIDAPTVDALHASAMALWDARRHPDRVAARAEFEVVCTLILLGAAQMFADGDPVARVEQVSRSARHSDDAEQMSAPQEKGPPVEQMSAPQWRCLLAAPSFDADEAAPIPARSFEEATRPPYTIIRPGQPPRAG